MKLLVKNNRIFFRYTLLLLLLGSLILYGFIDHLIREELDEKLIIEQQRIVDIISKNGTFPYFPPLIEVRPSEFPPRSFAIIDTMVYDSLKNEQELYRQLNSITTVYDNNYQIIVRTRLVDSEDLFFAIGLGIFLLGILLFVGLYWLNRWNTSKIWEPFQKNLILLRNFNLSQPTPIELLESDVTEFEELRSTLERLTKKVQDDYSNLKEFTEDASHEIQTPLAMIISKIEVLIEQGNQSKEQMKSIQEIYHAAHRLSRLNRNLILLTKIENRQFDDIVQVSFSEIVNAELNWLREMIVIRQLDFQLDVVEDLRVIMSSTLANVLVKNLFENALKYSNEGERIDIVIKSEQITFCNPGDEPIINSQRLFQRFYHQKSGTGSLGLGLAIVKKIGDVHGFKVGYQFRDRKHCFSISFPNE